MLQYLSLFSGIGAFEKALDNLKVEYDLVGYSEIDKYASKSYSAIHCWDESYNLGDITKIDEKSLPKNIDLVTYGFPCQDISLAGKQKGLFHEDGTQTRSGLFFEALRIIEETQPKIAIAENVKNLTSKKFKEQFEIVLSSLEEAGYNNYWKILNAKDYGIPQNRERVFIVSIRKDIDTGLFEFPEGFPLEKRLKDVLETDVDEKFYLNGNGTSGIIKALTDGRQHKPNIMDDSTEYAPTIDTRVGAQTHRSPYVTVEEATKQGYAEAYEGDSINLEQPNSKTRRGRVGKGVAQTLTTSPQQVVVEPFIAASRGRNPENTSDRTTGATTVQRLKPNSQGICNTLTTVQKDNYVCEPINTMPDGTCRTLKNQYYKTSEANFGRTSTFGATGVKRGLRIRKLTPKECFRLMGFEDEDFDLAAEVNSNTQLYKQAGNSIVVDVAEEILCMMLDENGNIFV